MAQPLYFLPGLRKAAVDSVPLMRGVLKERGLTDVFADVAHEHICVNELTGRGPGDKSGCVICYQTPSGSIPRRLGWYPKEQSWTPVGDGSLLWIGLDTAEPPGPDDLARRTAYGGYWIELADGNEWLVPLIRRPDGTTRLPCDLIWDASGCCVQPIKPRYQAFWESTAEVHTWFVIDEDGRAIINAHDIERALGLAVSALSINYRIGRNEQNIVRMIDAENYRIVLGATIDLPKTQDVIQAQKKMSGCQDMQSFISGSPEK